jgi:hypothetical protein
LPRQRDEAIPGDERLFRGLKAEEVDGDRMLDDAIDLRGTSCDRESLRSLPEMRARWKFVGAVRPRELPGNLRTEGSDVVWEFFAVDDPIEGNDAHCEVRIRRISQRGSSENDDAVRKRSPAAKAVLRFALASRFQLVLD